MFESNWKAIESEVPGLTIRSAILLGEGWTTRAYRVNDDLVFRFPKRSSEWEQLEREIKFLAYARPLLPVPVADHLFQIRSSAGAPHGYTVHRYIAGHAVTVGQLSMVAGTELTASLAQFLRALHDMGLTPEVKPTLRGRERKVSARSFRDALQKVAPGLTDSEQRRLGRLIDRHLADPGNFPTRSRVIHADLSAKHILCANNAVTGILDWGEVSLGDPDYDFGCLYGEFGEAFVREVASQYGHPDPEHLVRKAHVFWVLDQIDAIAYGKDRAPASDEAAAWRELRGLLHGDVPN